MQRTNITTLSIVTDWEDAYKKGQFTLWVLFAIADGDKYSQEITDFISTHTNGTLAVKDQSLYRALRRFRSAKIISEEKRPSPDAGPKRNYYQLTVEGKEVLRTFVARNIKPYTSPHITSLINKLQESYETQH